MSDQVVLEWNQWNIFGKLLVEGKRVFLQLSRAEVDGSPTDVPLANLRPIPLNPFRDWEVAGIVSAHTTGPEALGAAVISSLVDGKRYEKLTAQALSAASNGQ